METKTIFIVNLSIFKKILKSLFSVCTVSIQSKKDDILSPSDDMLLIMASKDKGRLLIKYYNNSIFSTAFIPANVKESGAFVVSAKLITSIPGTGDCEFNECNGRVLVNCGHMSTSFGTIESPMSVENLKPTAIDGLIKFNAKEMLNNLSAIEFSSTDIALPCFGMPVTLSLQNNQMTILINDHVYASFGTRKLNSDSSFRVTVPFIPFKEAIRVCSSKEVNFGYNEHYFRVFSDTISIYHPICLYDNFNILEYVKTEFKNPKIIAKFEAKALSESLLNLISLKRVQMKATSYLTIVFDPSESKAKLSYTNDIVVAKDEVKMLRYSGDSYTLETNGVKLSEFCKALAKVSSNITMKFSDGRILLESDDLNTMFTMPER